MPTLISVIVLIAVAILIGILLISFVLRDKKPPKLVAFIHGLVAVAGIGTLIGYAATQHSPEYTGVLFLFGLAVIGGLTLVIRHLRGKAIPKWLAGVHGILALFGFILLLLVIFTGELPR